MALEQLHHVETGDSLLAVGLQAIPGIGACGRIGQRQNAGGQDKSEGGAGQ
ncbi:hypothetical protein D3C78_1217630 [compost metagenome]